LLLIALAGGAPVAAQEAGGRVFALLVVDTDASIAGLDRDGEAMAGVLQKGFGGSSMLKLRVLRGGQVGPEAILDHFRSVPSGPNDVLLLYYSGHGATVEGRGHVLTTSHGNLARSTLRSVMESRRPRLTVLLTDCCATVLRLRNLPMAPGAAPPAPPQLSPLMRCLFLQHRGTVDVTSSSFGESSWSTVQTGGFFTRALTGVLGTGVLAPLDGDNDGFVTWTEIFDDVRSQTQSLYRNIKDALLNDDQQRLNTSEAGVLRKQLDQVPQAFALGEPLGRGERPGTVPVPDPGADPDHFAPNLGIRFRMVPVGDASGAELTQPPVPGSGAAQLQLEPGDTITVLDTLPIRSPLDVLNHHGRTSVVFINVRTHRPQSGLMTLPPYTPLPDTVPAEQYAANLRMHYQLTPNGDGTFGARLSRNAYPGTPVGTIGLERGDTILKIDGQPIRKPEDILAHYGRTTLEFINIRTGQTATNVIQLPGLPGR
jgi:hypothetical protein